MKIIRVIKETVSSQTTIVRVPDKYNSWDLLNEDVDWDENQDNEEHIIGVEVLNETDLDVRGRIIKTIK